MIREKDKPVWTADLGDGHYRNPILYADYSDPDVIRVGDDFYMVSSSFNMSPCLPILHSKDLVNWKIINHVSETFPCDSYQLPRHGDGVWAPSIRYHDGKFWVFFGAPDEGIYMSTTENPYGKWSPLHLVKKAKGWIDPCPFWDDDGQAYLVNAFARSRIGFKSILQICKMKPDGTELLDEGVYIFDGRQNHPTIEGPKMYKRNRYYYIFAPAGGVAEGWQTVLRSKYIYGPYEDKIVLHQGNTTTNGPHQGAWVELESGESWFLHFQDKDAYGRITHLQPMEWVNDWPVMGKNINSQGLGEPVDRWKKPRTSNDQTEIKVPQTSDDFKGETLGPQWQWQANFIKDWFALTENGLTLFAVNQPEQVNTLYETPNILTQKFPAPKFTATTKLHFYPERDGDYSGLIVLGYEYSGIMLKTQGERVCIAHIYGKQNNNQVTEEETVVDFLSNNSIFLRVIVEDGARCQLSYSGDGNAYSPVGKPFLASKGKWVGAQLGIFCLNQGIRKSSGYSQFEWFTIH